MSNEVIPNASTSIQNGQLPIDSASDIRITRQFSSDADAVILNMDVHQALSELPKEHFALIVSSPPYNIGKEYEKQVSLDYYLALQKTILKRLVQLLRPDGSLCWQVGNYVQDAEVFPLDVHFYHAFKALGLKLRNRVIWHFDHGLHASRRFSGRYETLLWFTKTDNYIFNLDSVRVPAKYPGKRGFKGANKGKPTGNPLGKNPSDFWTPLAKEWDDGIWEIPNVKANHPEKTEHPCQFPIELVQRCVLAFTDEGDSVLDPFAGVGSALIAAVMHNRKAVGIDRDSPYCDIAENRLKDFKEGRLRIRPLGKPVHKPTGHEKVAQIPPEWLESNSLLSQP